MSTKRKWIFEMIDDYKQRIRAATEKYSIKDNKELTKTRRRNKRPEKEVEKECLEWMRSKGWSVNIIEAKAAYDSTLGTYRANYVPPGFVDCVGNDPHGHAVFIEFKALGKRSTFSRAENQRQQNFVLEKINTNAFCVIVDSQRLLASHYVTWCLKRKEGTRFAREFLIECLPKNKKTEEPDLGLFGQTT